MKHNCKSIICDIYNNVVEDCANMYFMSKKLHISNRYERYIVCIIDGLIRNLHTINDEQCYIEMIKIISNCDIDKLSKICDNKQ